MGAPGWGGRGRAPCPHPSPFGCGQGGCQGPPRYHWWGRGDPRCRHPAPCLDAGLVFGLAVSCNLAFSEKHRNSQASRARWGAPWPLLRRRSLSFFQGGQDFSLAASVSAAGLTQHLPATVLFTETRVLGENYYSSLLLPSNNNGAFYFQCSKFPGEHSSPLS